MDAIIQWIESVSNGNQMIAGAISLWVLGVASYLLRSIPMRIYGFLAKHLTTEVVLTSQHEVFHNLLTWLDESGHANKFRKLKLSNGRWGHADQVKTTKSVGYGSHIMWYRCQPIRISLSKEETHTEMDKETITICKLGRSHKLFDDLIKKIGEKANEKKNMTKLYRYSSGDWLFSGDQPKRPVESVIIETEKMDLLKATLDDFEAREDWHVKHGVPYQLGILLYGPPGTGKTSLIKAIAAYTNRAVCIASLGCLSGTLEDMFQDAPEDSIVILEDVDTNMSMGRRRAPRRDRPVLARTAGRSDRTRQRDSAEDEGESLLRDWAGASLSSILNAIDGVVAKHGRVLVMTTNHPEKLDEALLRPGRVDLKLEVGYLNEVTFAAMLRRFFSDIPRGYFDRYRLMHSTLTGSTVQGDVLSKMTYQQITDKYMKR